MKYRIKDTKTTLKIIGIYQILGGIFGLCISGWLLMRTGQINGPILLIFLVAIGLYLFSIQSGNLILQKNRVKRGIIYSMIHHAIQVIAISTGEYKYEYYSGAKGTIGFEFTKGFEFNFGIGLSEFNFTINSDSGELFLFVNIFAIIVLIVLNDIYKDLFSIKTNDSDLIAEDSLNDSITDNE
ncbi:hypothetical protein [Marinifilum sp. D714]|uniref:hypothetical protein n=1 Tax=Marinifilum sp. D714 TaxID=2937523 RepID=UPI0027BD4573|nr:hypothetical protein [Marinifilum sp. D714]MDQ2180192.1 hypothetical protein [Marinifilum sp. D714]